jgi:hypothetical protein
MVLKKYFRQIFCQKNGFFTQNKAKLYKKWIIALVFEKNSYFFAENCRKSQEIVIITSTHKTTFASNLDILKYISILAVGRQMSLLKKGHPALKQSGAVFGIIF